MQFLLKEAVEILAQTPTTLETMLTQVSPCWTSNTEREGTWSPYDVVGHLIHGEKTDWIPRAKIILEYGEAREFEPFDRFAQFESSKGKKLDELLDEFAALRKRNLEILSELAITPEKLEQRGVHPAFGPVSLRQLLSTWVVHDLDHIVQVARTMAKQYSDEVGPWKEYLGILSDRAAQQS